MFAALPLSSVSETSSTAELNQNMQSPELTDATPMEHEVIPPTPQTPRQDPFPQLAAHKLLTPSPLRPTVPISPSSILKKRKSEDGSDDDVSLSQSRKRSVVFDDSANTRHEWTTDAAEDTADDTAAKQGYSWSKLPSSPRSAQRASPARGSGAPLNVFANNGRPKIQRQVSQYSPASTVASSAFRSNTSPARGLFDAFTDAATAEAQAAVETQAPPGPETGARASPAVAVKPPVSVLTSSSASQPAAVSPASNASSANSTACLFPALVDSLDPVSEVLSGLGTTKGLQIYLKARQV